MSGAPGWRTLDWVIVSAVAVTCAVVQIAVFPGPHPFDPARYFEAAVAFPTVSPDRWTLRIGLIAPVRAAVLVFGPSEAALLAVPIAAGALLAAAAYALLRVLVGVRLVAAAAGLATVLNGPFLLNGDFIFPDTVSAATFTGGMLCLVLGSDRFPLAIGGGRRVTAWAVIAGFLFGWTYLVREFSVSLLPVVVAVVLLLHYPLRRAAALLAAALATASLDPLWGLVGYADPLIHLDVLATRNRLPPNDRIREIVDQVGNPLDSFLVLPRLLLSWRAGWLLIALLVVFAVALAMVRHPGLVLLGIWLFGFWAVMTITGLVTLPSGLWVINVTNVRYWYPILPPLVLGGFGGLWLLLERMRVPAFGLRLAVVPALAVAAFTSGTLEFARCADRGVWRNDPKDRWYELRSWFASGEADQYDILRTDEYTGGIVPAFLATRFGQSAWHGGIDRFSSVSTIEPTGRDARTLILVDKPRISSPAAEDSLRDLSVAWSPVFASTDGALVILAHDAPGAAEPRPWWTFSSAHRSVSQTGECGVTPYEKRAVGRRWLTSTT